MQNVWHFSPLTAGLGLAPAPVVAIGFAVSAGPIQRRFGRTLPAVVGTVTMALAAGYWLLTVTATPSYWSAMFPALVLMGISGGLSQAPMFAAAGTLRPDRATTGSAVLNMSRQVGSAVGVALLVALTATANSVSGFDDAWWAQAAAGLLAATVLLLLRQRGADDSDETRTPHERKASMPELQVIAHHTMKEGSEHDVLALLPKLIEVTRTEPGNVAFDAYRKLDDPRTYVLLERYRSREAFSAHRDTAHFKDLVLDQIVPRLADRVIEEFDLEEAPDA
jgi:quinol monooxygenase YgiN